MNVPIYIGWDSRFPEPGLVLAHSLRQRSSRPLSIHFLDYRHLQDCHYFHRRHDPLATTEFAYSRFLVPYLQGYQGRAVFMDNDILCLANITALLDLSMEGLALRVVKHDYQPAATTKMSGVPQTVYPRKQWSSVMLMNCARLDCWTKEVVETAPGSRLHRFEDVPDELIGDLDPAWNVLDRMPVTSPTNLLHWTSGMLWNDRTKLWPNQDLWLSARHDWLVAAGLNPEAEILSQVMY